MAAIPPHRRDPPECDWCFDPLGDVATELNGGIGHPWCARFVYACVGGRHVIPWRPKALFSRQDPLLPFLERLGVEAIRLGIDLQLLARAIDKAGR